MWKILDRIVTFSLALIVASLFGVTIAGAMEWVWQGNLLAAFVALLLFGMLFHHFREY